MAERGEIRRLVAVGLEFQDVADRVRCSRKSVQRLMHGFMDPPVRLHARGLRGGEARGSLETEVKGWLRTGRVMRTPRGRFAKAGRIKDMLLISERPTEAEDRAVPGPWEGDLPLGKAGGSAVGMPVERSTRFVMLMRLPEGKTAERVNEALIATIRRLPDELKRGLT